CKKEEELIAPVEGLGGDDRSAHRHAVLVVASDGLALTGGIGKEQVRAERGNLVVFRRGSVESIGAALGAHVDGAAASVAVSGVGLEHLYLDLTDCVERRLVGGAEVGRGGGRAIQQEFIRLRGRSAHRNAGGAGSVVRTDKLYVAGRYYAVGHLRKNQGGPAG